MDKPNSRLYKRISLGAKVSATLVLVSESGVETQATALLVSVKDFSKSGIGVYAQAQLPMRHFVKVSIEGLECQPLEGRIVWSGPAAANENAPKQRPFRIGIDFMPRDDAARENQLDAFNQVTKLAASLGLE